MTSNEAMNSERINVRVPEGTIARIGRVLFGGEVLSAFFRRAVENELLRREADKRLKRGYFAHDDDGE